VRIVIRTERCEGHGRCYDIAPEVLGPDEDGHAQLLVADGQVPVVSDERAKSAVRNCPERALSLEF
jgi:ferredoxin